MRRPIAARSLTPADVPEDWRDAPLVLLAPVLDDVDPAIADRFGDATLAAAGQGWLRVADETATCGASAGRRRVPCSAACRDSSCPTRTSWAGGADAGVLQRLPVAAVTAGPAGALLYVNGERYEVRPRPAREVDPTGAGDVFAAAFLVGYHLEGDPWQARPWRVARRRSRWKARDGPPCRSRDAGRGVRSLSQDRVTHFLTGPQRRLRWASHDDARNLACHSHHPGAISATAQLNASKTATAIWDALPIEAKAETWGNEIYFSIGIAIAPESPRATVDMGDLGYWPPGKRSASSSGRRRPVRATKSGRPAR